MSIPCMFGTPPPLSNANCSSAPFYSESESQTLKRRKLVNDQDAFENAMLKSEGSVGFGLYAPTPDNMIFYHAATPSDASMLVSLT